MRGGRRGPALAVGAWLLVVAIAIKQTHYAFGYPERGLDFYPVRHAAEALYHGRPIYGDRLFVYPPTDAYIFFLTGVGSATTALHVWLALESVAVVLAVTLALASSRWRFWPLAAAAAALLTLRGDAFTDNLWLGNVSLLLAPIGVLVLLLFERDRWTEGCALLAVSLLVKPLLLPFLLLPVLYRRWHSIAITVGPALIALAISVVATPGGGVFLSRMRYVAAGGRLRGGGAVYNTSLQGLAGKYGIDSDVAVTGRTLVGALVLVIVWRSVVAIREPGSVAATGTLLLLATILAGSLSEAHYLLVAGPCVLLCIALRPDRRTIAFALPAFVALVAPRLYLGEITGSASGQQARYVFAEALLLVSAIVACSIRARGESATRARTREVEADSARSRAAADLKQAR